MVYNSKDKFFRAAVAMRSAVMVEEFKLTPKEIDFLGQLYTLHDAGVDISDFKNLKSHFLSKDFFKDSLELSGYKNKLRVKKWIKAGRNKLQLSPIVSKSPTQYTSTFEIKFK